MKNIKTRNLLFSSLIIMSLFSLCTIECIDHKIYNKTAIEIQELNKTKDQLVMKFEVFSEFVEKMVEVIDRRF